MEDAERTWQLQVVLVEAGDGLLVRVLPRHAPEDGGQLLRRFIVHETVVDRPVAGLQVDHLGLEGIEPYALPPLVERHRLAVL